MIWLCMALLVLLLVLPAFGLVMRAMPAMAEAAAPRPSAVAEEVAVLEADAAAAPLALGSKWMVGGKAAGRLRRFTEPSAPQE